MIHLTDDFGMTGAGFNKKYTLDQEEVLVAQAAENEKQRINDDAEIESQMNRLESGTILPEDL